MSKIESFQKEISLCLLESVDAKSFAVKAFRIYLEAHPKASFAELARSMGFSSRSFVRQLSLGIRVPNSSNHHQIAKGLKMSLEAGEFFALLIEKQRVGGSLTLDKKMASSELKLRRSLDKNIQRIRKTDPVPFERWPYVYASLGSVKVGRSFKDIIHMSGQDPKVTSDILDFLVQKNLITWDDTMQKYFPKTEMIDIGELGNSRILKSLYKHISMEALRRVDVDIANKESLFHSSVFSIRRDQMPNLTRDLQKLLASYAATAEDSEGKEIAMLSAAMVPMNRN